MQLEKPTSERRYLHIAGAFAAGGWFTGVGRKGDENIPIETVAPVHLPMVGGVSESKESRVGVHSETEQQRSIGRKRTEGWKPRKTRKLFSLGRAYSLAEAGGDPDDPYRSRTVSRIEYLTVGKLSLKRGVLNFESRHDPRKEFPQITFGPTEITGLKLGRYPLTVTVDTAPFNKCPTMEQFEKAFMANRLPKAVKRSLADSIPGELLYRNFFAYVVGSIVRSIEGDLPPGAEIEPDGYTINWPGFGRIVLGEVTMGAYIRRATLLRIEHSRTEYGSGCSGGSFYP